MEGMIQSDEIRRILKKHPFDPIHLALTDGRSVLIRHPD